MSDVEQYLVKWFAGRGRAVTWSTDAATDFLKAGWVDSFALVELIEDLEQKLGIRFTEADLGDARMATLAGLSAIVTAKQ